MTFVIKRMHLLALLNTKPAAKTAAIPKIQNRILTAEDCCPKKGYTQQKRPTQPTAIAHLDNRRFKASSEEIISTILLSSMLYPYVSIGTLSVQYRYFRGVFTEKQEKYYQ